MNIDFWSTVVAEAKSSSANQAPHNTYIDAVAEIAAAKPYPPECPCLLAGRFR